MDIIDAYDLDNISFRSSNYVIVVDQENGGERVGFGRYRVHKEGQEQHVEFTSFYIADEYGQEVWDTLLPELVKTVGKEEFEDAYVFSENATPFEGHGFEEVDETDIPETLRTKYTLKKDETDDDESIHILHIDIVEAMEELDAQTEEGPDPKEEGEELSEDEIEEYADEIGVKTDGSHKYST